MCYYKIRRQQGGDIFQILNTITYIQKTIVPSNHHMRVKLRCEWAANGSPTDIEYHDDE